MVVKAIVEIKKTYVKQGGNGKPLPSKLSEYTRADFERDPEAFYRHFGAERRKEALAAGNETLKTAELFDRFDPSIKRANPEEPAGSSVRSAFAERPLPETIMTGGDIGPSYGVHPHGGNRNSSGGDI